jgi:hypothetical protein
VYVACAMAGEWPGVLLIALCAVDVLGQVTHVDPVGYSSHEGTRCYDDIGRPQVSYDLTMA